MVTCHLPQDSCYQPLAQNMGMRVSALKVSYDTTVTYFSREMRFTFCCIENWYDSVNTRNVLMICIGKQIIGPGEYGDSQTWIQCVNMYLEPPFLVENNLYWFRVLWTRFMYLSILCSLFLIGTWKSSSARLNGCNIYQMAFEGNVDIVLIQRFWAILECKVIYMGDQEIYVE